MQACLKFRAKIVVLQLETVISAVLSFWQNVLRAKIQRGEGSCPPPRTADTHGLNPSTNFHEHLIPVQYVNNMQTTSTRTTNLNLDFISIYDFTTHYFNQVKNIYFRDNSVICEFGRCEQPQVSKTRKCALCALQALKKKRRYATFCVASHVYLSEKSIFLVLASFDTY